MAKTVLIVEDDRNIADLLRLYLEKEGYTVVIAPDGMRGVEQFRTVHPSLVLLDVMLPGLDGWGVCRAIRAESQTPIIMLTAKSETEDKVNGLKQGADDYITKPFEMKEVLARIEAVLRRSGIEPEKSRRRLEFDKLIIDMDAFELTVDGKKVPTPPKEMELLYHLASTPNRVYTRNQLLDEVWGFDYFGDTRTVDVHIKRLLLAATILLGVSFWGLFTHYVIRERESSLRGTAQSVVWLTQTSAVSDDVTTSWDFLRTLSVASSASGNDILLCDAGGKVVLCAQDIQGCSHIGYQLPADKVEALFNGESPDLNDEAAEIYGQKRVAVALARTSSDGDRQGIVLVSVERETISELTTGALKIFMLTALAVFAVALLATPFLTNRETKPIQDMAAAARQIAHGNLNVRVSTNCQTEEMEELAVAFNNMAAAMQNADTARQEFVANVSHELKTPMTTIAGYLDGMLDIPADKLADFDICEAAGQALLSFEQRINRKHLNVDVDMPELGVTVRAMPDAVTQVLYNLIDNAVKFIDDGGTLSIRVERSGNKAVTTVGNTGPTIAPEELPLIFDRFHKTDKSRSTDRDGVGLGLYIVKTIVLAHGEDIYVTSRDGKTEFTFTLPLVL